MIKTSLYSGEVISKNSLLIDAMGDLDELNSLLGILRSKLEAADTYGIRNIQSNIMNISSLVATNCTSKMHKDLRKITNEEINELLDMQTYLLKKVVLRNSFIIPGDNGECSAEIDYVRAVTRRCERKVVALIEKYTNDLLNSQRYLNDLSYFLFILARFVEQNSYLLISL